MTRKYKLKYEYIFLSQALKRKEKNDIASLREAMLSKQMFSMNCIKRRRF